MSGIEPEDLIKALESTGKFRVLRKLDLAKMLSMNDGSSVFRGIFLDIESTGLDPSKCEPIELAMLPFDYTEDGRVFSVSAEFHQFNEPSEPIPLEVTAITGITDEQVAGHKLDVTAIDTFAEQAALIVAHNAAFDRPIAERISPLFARLPWACTMRDVPWRDEGIEGRRLSDLLAQFSYFFDGHRAVDDCRAGIALNTLTLPKSGKRVMEKLLQVARRPTWRLFAERAPFEAKDVLKYRGYRWNTNFDLGPRAWVIDVDSDHVEKEIQFLESEILPPGSPPSICKITAFQRYANRSR